MQSTLQRTLNVAVIMDGNGRWAEARGLPRQAGHVAGVSALRDVVSAAQDLPINSLTVYAFSSDNWKRPAAEVGAILGLVRRYLERDLARLVEQGVRLSMIGRRDRLPADVVAHIRHAEGVTRFGDRLRLRIALDYSGRHAIAEAAGQCSNLDITADGVSHALCRSSGLCEIDFLIRTGGEQRLSDFLLWEAAYAELYFCKRLWPDFTGPDLAKAIVDYFQRERRYGGLINTSAIPATEGKTPAPVVAPLCATA